MISLRTLFSTLTFLASGQLFEASMQFFGLHRAVTVSLESTRTQTQLMCSFFQYAGLEL